MHHVLFSRGALLRIMLWSLGLGALAGVLGVFLGAEEVVYRIMWTGFVAGVTAAVMMPMSLMVDREAARPSGLLGMGAMLGTFLMVIVPLWELDDLLPGWADEEQFALSAVFLFLLTFPTMAFMRLTTTKHSALAGRVGIATGAITYLLVLAAIWLPDLFWAGISYSNRADEQLWATPWAVGACGVVAAVCLVHLDRQRRWRWLGIAAAVAGCLLLLLMIWGDDRLFQYAYHPDWRGKSLTIVAGVAIVTALANLLMLVPLRAEQRWFRVVTLVAACATTALIDLLVLYDIAFRNLDTMLERLTAAGGIVTICGSLGMVVLARINRGIEVTTDSPLPAELTLICPRCRRKHTLPAGETSCPTCRLRIHIRFEEPRCAKCGYLLFGLTGSSCPECGEGIGAEEGST